MLSAEQESPLLLGVALRAIISEERENLRHFHLSPNLELPMLSNPVTLVMSSLSPVHVTRGNECSINRINDYRIVKMIS